MEPCLTQPELTAPKDPCLDPQYRDNEGSQAEDLTPPPLACVILKVWKPRNVGQTFPSTGFTQKGAYQLFILFPELGLSLLVADEP